MKKYAHILDERDLRWLNEKIENLDYDTGKRCPAMDSEGYQCEDCQGHPGQHWVMKKKVYFSTAWNYYEEVEGDLSLSP